MTMLRKLLIPIIAFAIPAMAYTPVSLPVIPPDPSIEKKVRDKLAKMSLEEKIGQMTDRKSVV